MAITPSDAARLTGINVKTLHSWLSADQTRQVTAENRRKLRKLGLTGDEIEHAAALTAGYNVTPADVRPLEWARMLRMRTLTDSQVRYIDREIARFFPRRPR